MDRHVTVFAAIGRLSALDWSLVALVLVTTMLVGWIAGRRGSVREFFLGGRKLPWWAVSASLAATEISALTMVSVPALVFAPGGDLTYLQIALFGNVLARGIVAWVLVPAWFEREIYSPYDYVEARLGVRARQMTSALFAGGAVLAQGARLYVTALVLEVLLRDQFAALVAGTPLSTLALSIGVLGAVSLVWTLAGGMAGVVWADLFLFAVFAAAALTALWFAVQGLDVGVERLWQVGVDARKFDFLDFDRSPARAYTFWAALFAASWGGVGAYGMDQLMAQRVFCCADLRAARKAILWSSLSVLVTAVVALVGVALYAWYERRPLQGEALELYSANADRILPIFVLQAVPSPWKGLIVAGIFAAAISTLAGVFTALSHTALANLYDPWRDAQHPDAERRRLRAARTFVLGAGLALCASALLMKRLRDGYPSVLDLGLAMAGFTQGALLASFFLAWLARRPDGSGFLWSAPLSVLWVFGLSQHGPHTARACWLAGALLFLLWLACRVRPNWSDARRRLGLAGQTLALAAALVGVAWANQHALFLAPTSAHAAPEYALQPLQFPWYVPVGSVIAYVFGQLLARPVPAASAAGAVRARLPSRAV